MRKQFNLGAKAKVSQCIGDVEEEVAAPGSSLPPTWKALPLPSLPLCSDLPHAKAMDMGDKASLIHFYYVWVCLAMISISQKTVMQMIRVSPLSRQKKP